MPILTQYYCCTVHELLFDMLQAMFHMNFFPGAEVSWEVLMALLLFSSLYKLHSFE